MSYYLIILVLVQAVTEFLPVSSNMHLMLASHLLGTKNPNMNAILHLGTALSLCLYFFKDFIKNIFVNPFKNPIFIGTVPAVIGGLLFPSFHFTYLLSPISLLLALILYVADKNKQTQKHIGIGEAFIIGLFQCLAFVPGVSRMGITVTAARFLGIERTTSTKFSFLLAAPVSFGAFLLSARHVVLDKQFFVLTLFEALLGLIVLHALMRFIKRHSYAIFVLYRICFAIAFLALMLLTDG